MLLAHTVQLLLLLIGWYRRRCCCFCSHSLDISGLILLTLRSMNVVTTWLQSCWGSSYITIAWSCFYTLLSRCFCWGIPPPGMSKMFHHCQTEQLIRSKYITVNNSYYFTIMKHYDFFLFTVVFTCACCLFGWMMVWQSTVAVSVPNIWLAFCARCAYHLDCHWCHHIRDAFGGWKMQ